MHRYTKTTSDIKNIHASDVTNTLIHAGVYEGRSFMLLIKHQHQHTVVMEKCKAFMQFNKVNYYFYDLPGTYCLVD